MALPILAENRNDMLYAGFTFGVPKLEFDGRFYTSVHTPSRTNYNTYAVSADGQRLLIPRPQQMGLGEGAQFVTVFLNWKSLLQ